MVGVMVGDERPVQAASECAQPSEYRFGLRRVDHTGRPAGGVAQEIAVVVGEDRQQFDLERCHGRFLDWCLGVHLWHDGPILQSESAQRTGG